LGLLHQNIVVTSFVSPNKYMLLLIYKYNDELDPKFNFYQIIQ
jgi:hypothetical protein